jgi:hypothetical protein
VSGFTDAFERAGSAVALAGPVSEDRILRFEEAYELKLPRTLRKFVAALGDVAATDRDVGMRLLGLSDDPKRRPTIASSLYLARTAGLFPDDLVPVEILGEQQLACVRVDGSPDPPVVHIDLEADIPQASPVVLAPSFSVFANEWLSDVRSIGALLGTVRRIDRDVTAGKRPADKAARPDDWRAYRLCSQDIVVALLAVRHDRDENLTRVGALSIATLPDFPALEPARATMAAILCDAYRSGGTLEIRFQGGVGGKARPRPMPRLIADLMRAAGVAPTSRRDAIAPDAAAQLFAYCARLPDSVRAVTDGGPASLTAATSFAALSGLWDVVHLQVLLGEASDPGLLLRGGAHPLHRIAHLRDRETLRAALLAGTLDRTLRRRADASERDSEDDLRDVTFAYDAGVLRYEAQSPLLCDWWLDSAPAPACSIAVCVCAAGRDELPNRLPAAIALAQQRGHNVLVGRDYLSLPQATRTGLQSDAARHGVYLMVAPDYVLTLDADAEKRLARARTTRL